MADSDQLLQRNKDFAATCAHKEDLQLRSLA